MKQVHLFQKTQGRRVTAQTAPKLCFSHKVRNPVARLSSNSSQTSHRSRIHGSFSSRCLSTRSTLPSPKSHMHALRQTVPSAAKASCGRFTSFSTTNILPQTIQLRKTTPLLFQHKPVSPPSLPATYAIQYTLQSAQHTNNLSLFQQNYTFSTYKSVRPKRISKKSTQISSENLQKSTEHLQQLLKGQEETAKQAAETTAVTLMAPQKTPSFQKFIEKKEIIAEMRQFTVEQLWQGIVANTKNPIAMLSRFSGVLTKLAADGDVERGEALLEYGRKNLLKIEPRAYTSMITLYGNAMLPDLAEDMFYELLESGATPDACNCAALMSSFIRSGQIDRAFSVLEIVEKYQISPTVIMYTTLIQGFVKLGDFDRAWQVFDTLRMSHLFDPDEVTYNQMINSCVAYEQAERALTLWTEMKRKGLHPTEATFSTLINACAKRRDYYDECFILLSEMKEYGFAPTLGTMVPLLTAAAINGDVENAEDIFFQIKNNPNIDGPTVVVYTKMMHAYAKANQQFFERATKHCVRAEEIFTEMLANRIKPNLYVLNSLLFVYTDGLKFKNAEEFLKYRFDEHGVVPDLLTYTEMIRMYGRTNQIEKAFGIFELMKERNVVPDQVAYRSLFRTAARDYNWYVHAIQILKAMIKNGYPPERSLVETWSRTLPDKLRMKVEILCDFPHYASLTEGYKMWMKPFHEKPKKPGKFVQRLLDYRRDLLKQQIEKSKDHDWQRKRQIEMQEKYGEY